MSRDVPSRAALPVIRPALGRQHSISDRAKNAMQEYLNHFLGNMDIVNSREVSYTRMACSSFFFFFHKHSEVLKHGSRFDGKMVYG